MDAKERVRVALSHQEPDRVPLYEGAFSSRLASEILGRTCYIPSNGGSSFRHFLLACMEGTDALSEAAVRSGRDGIDLFSQLGIDAIRVRVTDFLTPVDFGYGNYGSNALFEVEISELQENRWRITGPEGFWSEHVYEPETDAMMGVDHSICHGGMDEFKRYVDVLERRSVDVPQEAEPGLDGVRAAVEAAKKTGTYILGWGDVAYPGSSPFLTLYLMGMKTEPQLIQRYMEITTEGALSFIRAQIQSGVDGILGGNDWCFNTGPMFSLGDFQEYFVPYLRKIVEVCHENGVPYIKHLDGNTTLLLDSLVNEVGIDGYHAIEPAAGMDIVKLKKQYGDRITLMGNIDCGELLSLGTPEQVSDQTRWIIGNVSPGGGHIFGSSNSIHDAVRLENVYAMLETAHEFGRYPIQTE